jgi:hypothetical protein
MTRLLRTFGIGSLGGGDLNKLGVRPLDSVGTTLSSGPGVMCRKIFVI